MRLSFLPSLLASAALAQTPIDFSYAGYAANFTTPPAVPTSITLRPTGSDDTAAIQSALDRVADLPARADGFRGAVLLRAGRYPVGGHLQIRASGVVLRGEPGAIVVATGTDRRTLIEAGNPREPTAAPPIAIADETVPAGALAFTLASVEALHPGDRIVITRPSTPEWIAALGMNHLPGNYATQRLDWLPGSRNLVWDRTLAAVDPARRQVTLDAPITTALERRYGGGTVARLEAHPPAIRIGIENLTVESEYDHANPRDEEHAWIAIALDHVEDAWVKNVTARHFAGSAVRVGPRARRVTIEDCRSEQPVSEPAGYRRQSFLVEGQQVLVRRAYSEHGMNDFAAGLLAAGPNVFLDATAKDTLGPSGAFESWASGVLYERVRIEGAGIRLTQDSTRAQGAGWTAANSVIWNCEGRELEANGPPEAQNTVRQSAAPLFEAQLAKRHPVAHALVHAALPLVATPAARLPSSTPVQIVNGRFVVDGKTLWGGAVNDGWWRGQAVPGAALEVGGVALTRFVPGRTGPGLTEDLAALANAMAENGTPFYNSIPGLWYDRRRDEHSIVSRTDANVWAPFYEMPWARSGQGTASDGLSRFDLTKFNPWYYARLREFGNLCDIYGLVLHHNLYNTHNLLEIPPHWVDYPWRPANNINETGLPEPPPIEPGNHIHVANEVYDIANPKLRALHRALILHELDTLGRVQNIFFSLGAQFAGPLAFQEFFQDTVAGWEARTGRRVRLELATSKDISDAILANPNRARQVAVIDMRYWQYRRDGTLWAPRGGQNLAFREMIARDFGRADDAPPNTTPEQVYRQVREYHDRYPDKAIVAWHGGAGPIPILMAGGAQALMRNPSGGHGQGKTIDRTPLDAFVREHLAAVLMNMNPRDGIAADPGQTWCLADEHLRTVLLYSLTGPTIELARPLPHPHSGIWFDPRTGQTHPAEIVVAAAIPKPTPDPWLLLVTDASQER